MSVTISVCTAEDIMELNQRKEYTLISTHLLQHLFTDPQLNAQAIKCWQLLFNKARFHPNLEITISYTKIAKELGRSKRSVLRYIDTLVNNGYLETISNCNQHEGKKPNTLLVRVPTVVIEKVQSTKDRTNNNTQINISTNSVLNKKFINEIEPTNQIFSLFTQNNQETITAGSINTLKFFEDANQPSMINQSIDICMDVEQPIIHTAQENIATSIEEGGSAESTNFNVNDPLVKTSLMPKLSLGGSDKIVTQKININKANNNNNTVVVSSSNQKTQQGCCNYQTADTNKEILIIDKQIKKLKFEQKQLEQLDQVEGLKLQDLMADHIAMSDHLKYLGSIRSRIHILQIEIDKLEKHAIFLNQTQAKEKILQTQIDYMLRETGGNVISPFTFERLLKALKSLKYSGASLTSLVNEIVFEVKFGSLTRSKDGEPLCSDHAINIALKLVREKRWSTPSFFKETKLSFA